LHASTQGSLGGAPQDGSPALHATAIRHATSGATESAGAAEHGRFVPKPDPRADLRLAVVV
jgi:hypothetical protein